MHMGESTAHHEPRDAVITAALGCKCAMLCVRRAWMVDATFVVFVTAGLFAAAGRFFVAGVFPAGFLAAAACRDRHANHARTMQNKYYMWQNTNAVITAFI